jgi:hypothetical protein
MAASAPVGPWDIEGKIERLQWLAETWLPPEPMMSGTLGGDRVLPAHYSVWLRVTQMTPSPSVGPGGDFTPSGQYPTMTPLADPPWTSSQRSRPLDFFRRRQPRSPLPSSPVQVAHLKLPHPQNDQLLQVGMQIRVTEYCEYGDEGGTWPEFQAITVQPMSPTHAPED